MFSIENNVDYLLNNGIDFNNHIIYIIDNVGDSGYDLNYDNCIKSLVHFSKKSSKPVKIVINSFGGDIYEALSIVDTINCIPNEVIGIGLGLVASASSLILAACDKRYLTDNSYIMIHELSSDIDGSHTNQKNEVIHQDNILNNMCGIYSKVMKNKSHSEILNMLKNDCYLTASEAIKVGFINKIIDKNSFKKIINTKNK